MARPGLARGGSVPGRVIESGGSAGALLDLLEAGRKKYNQSVESRNVNYKQRKEESFNIDEFTTKDVDMSEEQKYNTPDIQLNKRHTFTTHANSSTPSWDNNPRLAMINDQDYVYQSLLSNNTREDDGDIDFDDIEAFDSPDSSASSCMCCV
ncbi:unnamed protein product [Didymodactylos carnosus]|uniref:Uncharacterized protein n=1 Tax=Didymodactylos carnosus TaxID=1234261 RepID=A0A815BU61_9BILA|nr:unnamed protein product [Didymodactylos carnosus]CAF4065088.1 unnamed protein product [Didymodactylos carnosus]